MNECYHEDMNRIIALILIALVVIGALFYYQKNKEKIVEESIVGCYRAELARDVYSLDINSQEGENFQGTLVFDNFEKDSSSGTFDGTYKDSVLLGTYSFRSEGMDSVMQMIFKKVGDDFVRGYGNMDEMDEVLKFTNIEDITYDNLAIFKSTEETCATAPDV